MRLPTAVEAAAVAAAALFAALLGTGLGLAAVQLDSGPRTYTPLHASHGEEPQVLNRDRVRLHRRRLGRQE